MEFGEAVAEWREFYLLAGTGAVTLLGLLFIAVSLRLNIFRQREVADVRDFAFQTLTDFLFVGLIALVLLIPSQSHAGVGLPLTLMGVAGTIAMQLLAQKSRRLNEGSTGPYRVQ